MQNGCSGEPESASPALTPFVLPEEIAAWAASSRSDIDAHPATSTVSLSIAVPDPPPRA